MHKPNQASLVPGQKRKVMGACQGGRWRAIIEWGSTRPGYVTRPGIRQGKGGERV